ncbi:hypothetical protein WR25_01351 [Diploscapter pachys]|uniref:receptor protein-tyrosine kinase n=1 Tax=Diploscapter pachys TaxID=2018661 RepID=A0A2A2JHU4_9BILA|nr:hypothetical protein WR25_01351 [Diploscapter pachys]
MASEKCECRQGWYRAEEDLPNSSCTKAPGRPSLVEHYNLGQNSVTLRWNEPVDLGGRHEVWYEWECTRGECATIKPSPADKRLHSRTLVLSGLEPDTDYSFNIYAKNKVSDLSEAASYKSVDFRTLPFTNYQVSGIRIDQVQGNGITVVWQQPAVAKRIREYEVEITPSVNGNEAKEIRLSNESHLNLYGLHSGVTYTFRIRVNVDGWGRWSSPVMYEVGKGQMISHKTEESSSSAVGHVPVWLIVVSVAALSLVFLSILIACRRQKRNRKQMSDLDVLDTYKQDTMTPDYNTNHRSALHPANGHVYRSAKLNAPLISYGSPISQPPPYYGAAALTNKYKPYVDPTAYEDPNQALSEFTFDIDPKAVFITQVIGGGEFGDVCRGGIRRSALSLSQGGVSNAIFENDIETVAIKTLKPGSSTKAKGEFLVEASIMGQFSHPNVIRLIGVVTRSEPAMIVTEYMANGSLDHFLRSRDARNEDISWTRIADMLRGIAAGMKYLTDKGFVHRDLAARNVLVDAELTCKIADFGLSRGVDDSVDQEYTTNGGKIPVRWTSPEAITHRKFTASSDVWSFGVVIWEVCSFGERPYWDWTNQKVISEVMLGYRLPAPLDCPPSLHRLAQWCWRLDRHERPSFAQLLSILEKYVNSPTLLESDPGMLPRHAVSSINISTPPVPPSSNPPIYPSLVEFLRSLGMTHCLEKLQAADTLTVEELSTKTHLDLLAIA